MFYGHTMFIGGKSQKDICLLRFITVASGGFKTRFKFNNIIATVSYISSVKNSAANTIKLAATIFNLVSFSLFDWHDSFKPEKINISLLSGCCKMNAHLICNISKTSASVSSGVPNTEKVMKARGRRPSAFIVSRCLEPLMKHEARVFDMASQMKQ